MKKYLLCAVILACLPLTHAQQLTQELSDAAASSAPAWRVRILMERRASWMEALIATDPAAALDAALPPTVEAQLRRIAPDARIESRAEWSGRLEAVVADDFVNHRSTTLWYLSTRDERLQLYFTDVQPRRSNTQVRVTGLRSGIRVAVASSAVESAQSVQRSAALASAPACTTTGNQKIAVIVVTTPSQPVYPTGFTTSFFNQAFFGAPTGVYSTESLNSYWLQTSYNLTSASGTVVGPFALAQDYTCGQTDALLAAAVAAADGSVDFTQFSRVAIMFPVATCSFGGLGSIGCQTITSPSKGDLTESVAWFPIFPFQTPASGIISTLAHEHGHNLGLSHGNSDDYNTIPLGPLASPGMNTEYGDPFTAMGDTAAGQYGAEHKSLILKWLKNGTSDYQEVSTSGTYTVSPLESSSGTRGLRVLRDPNSGAWLWVEYRQPLGSLDSNFATFPSNDIFNGALIHYEDPFLEGLHTYLLDFNPIANPNDFFHTTLHPGGTWSDPNSLLTLTVNSATSNALSVGVTYAAPCATLSLSSGTFTLLASTGTITVTAPGNCAWTASTPASWITLTGATSGNGNGTVPFSVAQNTNLQQREGYITVQRQSLPILQSGAGLAAVSVSPRSGTGTSTTFTFVLNDSGGYADISYANLYIYDAGGSTCQVQAIAGGFFYLIADDGSFNQNFLTSNQAGQSTGNSVCTIYGAGTSMTGSGNQLTITLQVSFFNSFAGTHQVAAQVSNNSLFTGVNVLGTWTVPVSPLAVFTTSLPSGTIGAPYSEPVTAVGGTPADTWALFSGTLPSGLAISSAGVISGTPLGTGTSTFTLRVTDSLGATANATFSIVINAVPVLAITKTHTGNFNQGATGVTYTITVSNTGGPTNDVVTMREHIPTGLTVTAMSGTGWTCTLAQCTRSDVLNGASSYPAVTVTATVAANATSGFNQADTYLGGGNAFVFVNDFTTIVAPSSLSITKTHIGNFTQGQTGATYTVTVKNAVGAGATNGAVTVADTPLSGMTVTAMSGNGWNCAAVTSCTRSDSLAANTTWPSITVTVNVDANAFAQVTNRATVSGGGSPTASTTDLTSVASNGTPVYIVGDTFPFSADTIGNFGDGLLNTVDLIAVLRAASGIAVPGACTDRFDAMDAFPADNGPTRGGDGVLNALDLLAVLRKVSSIDVTRPTRVHKTCPSVQPQSRLRGPVQGALEFDAGAIYLRATSDLRLTALVLSLGDAGKFTPATLAPDLIDSALPGVVSLAWLHGLQVKRGERLLLGNVTSRAARVIHASANDAATGRDVNLSTSSRTR